MSNIQAGERQPAPVGEADATLPLEAATRLISEPIIPELLDPLLHAAHEELTELVRLRGWHVSVAAVADIAGWYRQMLARLTNLVVVQRFSSYQLIVNPLWRPAVTAPGDAPQGAGREVLDAYINWEEIERLLSDEGPYPELGRLLRSTRANWLTAATELMERTHQHQGEIARLVACDRDALGPLTGARFGISDPHGGGRTAAILSFGDYRVVYKPRSLESEIGWEVMANRVLRESLGLEGYGLKIASFNGYGFMQFVTPAPCDDAAAVQRCYERYGALLALAHALGTCDLHHENIIVSGEQPVIIDAEPLFRARLAVSQQGEDRLKFERNLSLEGLDVRESVLELGMLPLTMRAPLPTDERETRAEYDIGALCAYGSSPIRDVVPCGRGSDNLQMRYVSLVATEFPNLPILGGQPQAPTAFLDAIVAGFEPTHRYLRAHAHEYIGPGGLLDGLASAEVRLLARPTMDYATLLARSLSPEPLRSTEERSRLIATDLEQVGALRFDTVHDLEAREAASLMAGDIPRFELRADQAHCGDALLLTPPLESARTRWAALDEFDSDLQVTAIRERLLQRERAVVAAAPRSASQADLERHALEVVSSLVAAVRSPKEDPYWVYASFAPGFGATMGHADRESLYEGAAGTAVAVAEAGRLSGERAWCRLAARVFDPLVRGETPVALRRSGGIGRGLGGLLYAMTRVADATGEERLLDAALRIAVEYGPHLAREDGLDEVLYGRAGLLLGLLALHGRRPDARLRSVADVTARELLTRAVRTEHGTHWPVPAGRPMPHMSHGAAGVAMALARWAKLRGAQEGADAAVQALAFDDTFWIAEERGWLDARIADVDAEQRTTWAWCNGRTGALLARRAVADALGRPFHTGHVPSALHAHSTDIITDVSPGLCCGTPGAVDALLHLQQHPECNLSERASEAVALLATQTPRSHYSTLTASLFAGTAGLAFALLRAARPAAVAPLLWFG